MTRILLIEDEEGIGQALEYQLKREGYEVSWARDGTQGLRLFEVSGADLVVLDLMLPGISGEDVCKQIRTASTVPVLILTAKDSEVDKVVGLELGADDYVTKPFSTRELIARIRAIMRRSAAPTGTGTGVLEAGGIRLDPSRAELTVNGQEVHLPRKEFELLELLMSNSGLVLSRDTLMDEVWGSDYFGDTRTLDVHIKRLRAKCEPDPHIPRHITTIRGLGYKFVP
ncbi:MAG TPA: response regulator transcription factor [Actinomycetota bacterium]|nr:response regulator transcription factor [Actinomycetota bacterium]